MAVTRWRRPKGCCPWSSRRVFGISAWATVEPSNFWNFSSELTVKPWDFWNFSSKSTVEPADFWNFSSESTVEPSDFRNFSRDVTVEPSDSPKLPVLGDGQTVSCLRLEDAVDG